MRTTQFGKIRATVVCAVLLALAPGVAGAQPAPLTITVTGNGKVSVNGGKSVGCTRSCHATFRLAGRQVVLTARPGPGSRFTHWSGSCLGIRPACTLRLGGPTRVTAVFTPPPAARSRPGTSTVTVTTGLGVSEFDFFVSPKTVRRGTVTFDVRNDGTLPHDFEICAVPSTTPANSCDGTKTPLLAPGQSARLTVTFTGPGTYEYLSTVTDDAGAGMKGFLTVT